MKSNKELVEFLDKICPFPKCGLNYENIYQLLVMTILSAQASDLSINKIAPSLFKLCPDLSSLANVDKEKLMKIIAPLGMANNKTKYLINTAQKIIRDFNGIIPSDKRHLETLDGVGSKVASVILVEGYKIPAFPVDTHIARISKRLHFVEPDASIKTIENYYLNSLCATSYGRVHLQIIYFGRNICLARRPNCQSCPLNCPSRIKDNL